MRRNKLPWLLLLLLLDVACNGSKNSAHRAPEPLPLPARTEALEAGPKSDPVPNPSVAEAPSSFSADDFARHVADIRRKYPIDGFHVVVQPPFVVVGDEAERVVHRHARETVKWTVDRLKKDFFSLDPERILTIWLFRDEASYRRHAMEFFGDAPSTPYGYYSSSGRALVMNIATGGGTLVHEIVHPFMEANFAACPAWFNEGLGSLYEQCGDRNGQIWGYTNWRLPGLQRAIRARQVPSFERLLSTTDDQFYREDPGTNYAQARYLCYYLQERGLLTRFYEEYRANWRSDPHGVEALKRVLGTSDLVAFKTQWEAFVLNLRFPEDP